MNERDPELPDLSYKIRFALQAGRLVKPGPALEERVFRALDAVDDPGASRRKDRRRRLWLPAAFVMVGSMAAGVAIAVVVIEATGGDSVGVARSGVESTDMAVQLSDAGDVWVDLPVDTGRHDADRVLVSFNAPASVSVHLDDGDPSDYQRECAGYRCVHRWETSAHSTSDDGATPRVRITEPGRYEFSVTHASAAQSYNERFVVLATP